MKRKPYPRLEFIAILISLSLYNFHSVNAFHEGNGEDDHSVYLRPNTDTDESERLDLVKDIQKKSKPIDGIIVETDEENQPTTKDVSSTIVQGVVSTTASTVPTTTSKFTTTKSPNKPKQKVTVKPSKKSTERQFAQQKDAQSQTTKKSSTSASSSEGSTNPDITTTALPSTLVSNNSSEMPNATINISTTTPKPSIPTEKPKPPPNDLYCLCDLHIHSCDMNCCCDIDCSDEDRAMFTECVDGAGLHDKRSVPRRQRSCYQSFVFYKHYETQTLHRTDNGLLCILRDNNRDDNELSSDVDNEVDIDSQRKYGWGNGTSLEYNLSPYQFGNPIFLVKNSTSKNIENPSMIGLFGLPASYHDSSCIANEPVRFLETVHSRCRVKLNTLTESCANSGDLNANSLIKNIQIIGNPGDEDPQLMSITIGKQCNGDLCTSEADDTEKTEFTSPTLNKRKQLCQDVLMSLNFTIFHEGIDGILEVVVDAQLQDVSLNRSDIFQEYNVNFVWYRGENDTNTTNSTEDNWPRSGNPGYIVGKPVILGEKVKSAESPKDETKPTDDNDQDYKEEERILVSKYPFEWMTILAPGICSIQSNKKQRLSVLFDYGHASMCSLITTGFKYCEDVQMKIAKLILGSDDPVNFEKRAWYVAAYGNSNPAIVGEWVPLTYKNFPIISTPKGSSKTLVSKGCEGIVSVLHITILYSFVGSVDFPQARITGVLYELGDSTRIPLIEDDLGIKSTGAVLVGSTVTFKDVTSPPVTRIAKWPVVSIRLPADFFYPFSSPSSAPFASPDKPLVHLILIFILINVRLWMIL